MSNQNQMDQGHTPKRRSRGCLLWLGGFVVFVLGVMLVGAMYESAAEAADLRAYPPPGQMVDVGGYHLHLNCLGTGSPTVVIDAGWGDWSAMWSWVQPEVAKTTRVCTYDRAGMGYSEAGPLPLCTNVLEEETHMAKVKIVVQPSGCINGRLWPEAGETMDLPDPVAETMAGAGHVEIVGGKGKVEKRPAARKGVEKRG